MSTQAENNRTSRLVTAPENSNIEIRNIPDLILELEVLDQYFTCSTTENYQVTRSDVSNGQVRIRHLSGTPPYKLRLVELITQGLTTIEQPVAISADIVLEWQRGVATMPNQIPALPAGRYKLYVQDFWYEQEFIWELVAPPTLALDLQGTSWTLPEQSNQLQLTITQGLPPYNIQIFLSTNNGPERSWLIENQTRQTTWTWFDAPSGRYRVQVTDCADQVVGDIWDIATTPVIDWQIWRTIYPCRNNGTGTLTIAINRLIGRPSLEIIDLENNQNYLLDSDKLVVFDGRSLDQWLSDQPSWQWWSDQQVRLVDSNLELTPAHTRPLLVTDLAVGIRGSVNNQLLLSWLDVFLPAHNFRARIITDLGQVSEWLEFSWQPVAPHISFLTSRQEASTHGSRDGRLNLQIRAVEDRLPLERVITDGWLVTWTGPGINDDNRHEFQLFNLTAGDYLAEVTHRDPSVYCQSLPPVRYTIEQPNPIIIQANAKDASSYNRADGEINGFVVGGSPEYELILNAGEQTTAVGLDGGNFTFANLVGRPQPEGRVYIITVRDSRGQRELQPVEVLVFSPPRLTIELLRINSPVDWGCEQGLIEVGLENDIPGTSWNWLGLPPGRTINTFIATDLPVGEYTVIAEAPNGDRDQKTYVIRHPDGLPPCRDVANYDWAWNNLPQLLGRPREGEIEQFIIQADINRTVSAPPNSCLASCCDGLPFQVTILTPLFRFVLGQPYYRFPVTGVIGRSVIVDLPANQSLFELTVETIDQVGIAGNQIIELEVIACINDEFNLQAPTQTYLMPVVIDPPFPIEITVIEVIPATRFGRCDATIRARVEGGNLPLTASLNTGERTIIETDSDREFIINNVCGNIAGAEYTLQARDEIGRVSEPVTVIVLEPPRLQIRLDDTASQITVNYGCETGLVVPEVITGTPPYTYIWSTGHDGPELAEIGVGNYQLEMIDATGSRDFLIATVNHRTNQHPCQNFSNYQVRIISEPVLVPQIEPGLPYQGHMQFEIDRSSLTPPETCNIAACCSGLPYKVRLVSPLLKFRSPTPSDVYRLIPDANPANSEIIIRDPIDRMLRVGIDFQDRLELPTSHTFTVIFETCLENRYGLPGVINAVEVTIELGPPEPIVITAQGHSPSRAERIDGRITGDISGGYAPYQLELRGEGRLFNQSAIKSFEFSGLAHQLVYDFINQANINPGANLPPVVPASVWEIRAVDSLGRTGGPVVIELPTPANLLIAVNENNSILTTDWNCSQGVITVDLIATGTPPLQWQLTNSLTQEIIIEQEIDTGVSFTDLKAGSYMVTVTDQSQITRTETVNINHRAENHPCSQSDNYDFELEDIIFVDRLNNDYFPIDIQAGGRTDFWLHLDLDRQNLLPANSCDILPCCQQLPIEITINSDILAWRDDDVDDPEWNIIANSQNKTIQIISSRDGRYYLPVLIIDRLDITEINSLELIVSGCLNNDFGLSNPLTKSYIIDLIIVPPTPITLTVNGENPLLTTTCDGSIKGQIDGGYTVPVEIFLTSPDIDINLSYTVTSKNDNNFEFENLCAGIPNGVSLADRTTNYIIRAVDAINRTSQPETGEEVELVANSPLILAIDEASRLTIGHGCNNGLIIINLTSGPPNPIWSWRSATESEFREIIGNENTIRIDTLTTGVYIIRAETNLGYSQEIEVTITTIKVEHPCNDPNNYALALTQVTLAPPIRISAPYTGGSISFNVNRGVKQLTTACDYSSCCNGLPFSIELTSPYLIFDRVKIENSRTGSISPGRGNNESLFIQNNNEEGVSSLPFEISSGVNLSNIIAPRFVFPSEEDNLLTVYDSTDGVYNLPVKLKPSVDLNSVQLNTNSNGTTTRTQKIPCEVGCDYIITDADQRDTFFNLFRTGDNYTISIDRFVLIRSTGEGSCLNTFENIQGQYRIYDHQTKTRSEWQELNITMENSNQQERVYDSNWQVFSLASNAIIADSNSRVFQQDPSWLAVETRYRMVYNDGSRDSYSCPCCTEFEPDGQVRCFCNMPVAPTRARIEEYNPSFNGLKSSFFDCCTEEITVTAEEQSLPDLDFDLRIVGCLSNNFNVTQLPELIIPVNTDVLPPIPTTLELNPQNAKTEISCDGKIEGVIRGSLGNEVRVYLNGGDKMTIANQRGSDLWRFTFDAVCGTIDGLEYIIEVRDELSSRNRVQDTTTVFAQDFNLFLDLELSVTAINFGCPATIAVYKESSVNQNSIWTFNSPNRGPQNISETSWTTSSGNTRNGIIIKDKLTAGNYIVSLEQNGLRKDLNLEIFYNPGSGNPCANPDNHNFEVENTRNDNGINIIPTGFTELYIGTIITFSDNSDLINKTCQAITNCCFGSDIEIRLEHPTVSFQSVADIIPFYPGFNFAPGNITSSDNKTWTIPAEQTSFSGEYNFPIVLNRTVDLTRPDNGFFTFDMVFTSCLQREIPFNQTLTIVVPSSLLNRQPEANIIIDEIRHAQTETSCDGLIKGLVVGPLINPVSLQLADGPFETLNRIAISEWEFELNNLCGLITGQDYELQAKERNNDRIVDRDSVTIYTQEINLIRDDNVSFDGRTVQGCIFEIAAQIEGSGNFNPIEWQLETPNGEILTIDDAFQALENSPVADFNAITYVHFRIRVFNENDTGIYVLSARQLGNEELTVTGELTEVISNAQYCTDNPPTRPTVAMGNFVPIRTQGINVAGGVAAEIILQVSYIGVPSVVPTSQPAGQGPLPEAGSSITNVVNEAIIARNCSAINCCNAGVSIIIRLDILNPEVGGFTETRNPTFITANLGQPVSLSLVFGDLTQRREGDQLQIRASHVCGEDFYNITYNDRYAIRINRRV